MRIKKELLISLALAAILLTSCENLVTAARNNRIDSIQNLINEGADVNERDTYGRSALMYSRSQETARLLIDAGADVNGRDKRGWTPLMFAARYGRTDVIKVLLESGADVDIQDEMNFTPLLSAAGIDCNEVEPSMRPAGAETVGILLKAGADLDAKDNQGKTALMYASYYFVWGWPIPENSFDTVRRLLESGADLNARDKSDRTALDWSRETVENKSRPQELIASDGRVLATVDFKGIEEMKRALERLEDVFSEYDG